MSFYTGREGESPLTLVKKKIYIYFKYLKGWIMSLCLLMKVHGEGGR
jgi:hypothetical protein